MKEHNEQLGGIGEAEAIAPAEEKKTSKKGRWIDRLFQVLTLLMAFLFWLYVFATNDSGQTIEKTFDVVPVQIEGDDFFSHYGLAVQDQSIYNLNISLKGTRSALGNVTNENMTVYIDVSDIQTPGVYTKTVKYSLPSGVALADTVQKTEVEVTVDTVATKGFTLDSSKLFVESFSLAEHLTPDIAHAVLNVDYVKFEAPTMLLDRIMNVRVRSTATLTLSGNSNLSAVVEALDEAGEVISSPDMKIMLELDGTAVSQAAVSLPLILEKVLPVTLKDIDGFIASDKIALSPSVVTVKGDPSVVSAMTEIALTPFSAKNLTKKSGSTEFTLSLPEMPEGVYEILSESGDKLNNTNVKATVVLQEAHTLRVPSSMITIIGGKNAEVLATEVQLTVRAVSDDNYFYLLQNALNEGADGVSLVVDLSKVGVTGEINADASVYFTANFENKLYEVYPEGAPYTVKIRINK